ncbi:hypothetical protein B0J14DRAFT_631566 [Halenospora varia]|nr:hypothetical protein B0J14DRAFT_631566 [Halenospora varia]
MASQRAMGPQAPMNNQIPIDPQLQQMQMGNQIPNNTFNLNLAPPADGTAGHNGMDNDTRVTDWISAQVWRHKLPIPVDPKMLRPEDFMQVLGRKYVATLAGHDKMFLTRELLDIYKRRLQNPDCKESFPPGLDPQQKANFKHYVKKNLRYMDQPYPHPATKKLFNGIWKRENSDRNEVYGQADLATYEKTLPLEPIENWYTIFLEAHVDDKGHHLSRDATYNAIQNRFTCSIVKEITMAWIERCPGGCQDRGEKHRTTYELTNQREKRAAKREEKKASTAKEKEGAIAFAVSQPNSGRRRQRSENEDIPESPPAKKKKSPSKTPSVQSSTGSVQSQPQWQEASSRFVPGEASLLPISPKLLDPQLLGVWDGPQNYPQQNGYSYPGNANVLQGPQMNDFNGQQSTLPIRPLEQRYPQELDISPDILQDFELFNWDQDNQSLLDVPMGPDGVYQFNFDSWFPPLAPNAYGPILGEPLIQGPQNHLQWHGGPLGS